MSDQNVRNVIIIGSGPAGLTAAIYAARANLKPLCIEGFQAGGIPGGQLMITTTVENYPGFPEGITGPDLMAKWREQAGRFGTDFITADVDHVDLSKRPFEVRADDETHRAHAIIVATGAKAKWLGLESEHELENHGVSACATCDGFFFKEQEVCVVGGGDTACEEALYLAGLCSKVTLIHRRQEFRASKIMSDRVRQHPKIELLLDSAVTEVLDVSKKKVTGVKVKNLVTGDEQLKACTGLFIAIGHEPNTQLFKGVLDTDELGYLKTKPGTTQTNLEGVWACGDVQDHVYRQAVTAAGTGCMAAIEVERWLGAKGLH
ncbi:MAG: thioredoxin-disulfide reductase [Sandaracinaceae bacterium]|nr:thioredoxin-disulfide reductase [Sandaracinaceae bacterium]